MSTTVAKKPVHKTKIHPLAGKVALLVLEADDRTPGGIVIPDKAQEKPRQARVVAVGEGDLLESGLRAKPQVDVGDRIIFAAYAGTTIKEGGVEYLLVDEGDIQAVIRD